MWLRVLKAAPSEAPPGPFGGPVEPPLPSPGRGLFCLLELPGEHAPEPLLSLHQARRGDGP